MNLKVAPGSTPSAPTSPLIRCLDHLGVGVPRAGSVTVRRCLHERDSKREIGRACRLVWAIWDRWIRGSWCFFLDVIASPPRYVSLLASMYESFSLGYLPSGCASFYVEGSSCGSSLRLSLHALPLLFVPPGLCFIGSPCERIDMLGRQLRYVIFASVGCEKISSAGRLAT